jgi:hypothetical protein
MSNKLKLMETSTGLTMRAWQSLMKDEKLYTQFGPIRSCFLATPISKFLTLFQKIRNLVTFSKLAYLMKYFIENLQK